MVNSAALPLEAVRPFRHLGCNHEAQKTPPYLIAL